ncbi:hypothetical protein ACFVT2_27275 [Streptomyces sp. NPDC058000]|uniref:hypothetical protein n=1 Tax=Streptomyces sp. NPDC058000 TaxID=3346299 RepID=UPI0036E9274D
MLAAAWLVHRLVERPLGAWLRTRMRRGIDDVRQHVAPRRRHARPTTPPTPTVPRQAEGDRTSPPARTFESV